MVAPRDSLRCCAATPRRAGGQQVLCAPPRRRHRCCSRSSARSSSARRGRCWAALPARPRVTGRLRAMSHLDAHAPAELTDVEGSDAFLTVLAPHNTSELAGVDRPAGARRAHARRRSATSASAAAGAGPCGRRPPGRSRRGWRPRLRRAHRARAFPRPRRPGRRLGRAERPQERLIERLTPARELRIEAEGTDLRLNVEGRVWVNSKASATCPPARSSPDRTRTPPRCPSAPRSPRARAAWRSRGSSCASRPAAWSTHARSAARLPARDARHRRGRLAARRDRDRDELRHRPAGREILLDEKIGGTVHLAVGDSYRRPAARTSRPVHWT